MSLSITYNELQQAVGRYLGYGRIYGPDNGSSEWADIEDCIKSGLRQFYAPPPIESSGGSYHWSFLRPVATLSLIASIADYDMPDDFGGINGILTYPDWTASTPVVVGSESDIRTLRQLRPQTGKPTQAAIRPKASDGTSEQTFEIVLWPTPDADIELTYRYYVLPRRLSDTNPYQYGGAAHSETVLESCLSMAEQRLNDQKGIHWEKFMERLSASVQLDKKTTGADFLGYNADHSDNTVIATNNRFDTVTVNGQIID